MSYCRWSTDCFRCDVYAYQAHEGFEIHVAGRRRDIPPDWMDLMLTITTAEPEAWLANYNNQQTKMEELPWITITTPSAGATFVELTLEDFRDRMLALRAEGIRFPDDVLEGIEEEIVAGRAA